MHTESDSPQTEGHGHEEVFDPKDHRPSRQRLLLSMTAVGALLIILVTLGVIPRLKNRSTLHEDGVRRANNPPKVHVTKPIRGTHDGLSLPGSLSPYQETIVYARVNGYLRNYHVDIGDRVKKGQVLAEIETPDLDQQLKQARALVSQARAGIAQTKSKLELAQVTDTRYSALLPGKFVSAQAGDESHAHLDVQKADLQASNASLESAEANAQHLTELKNFATLVAPFNGVITLRTTEEGQLVTTGMTTPQAIFKVARTDVLRMFVNVPQLYAPSLHIGEEAKVTVREFPDRTFNGVVTRTTRELDSATRTLITQIDVPNPDDVLISGMYAQASLPVVRADAPLLVPSTALVFNSEGTRMAVVENGILRWRRVRIDSDQGATMAISSGLRDNDDVVVTPSDRLIEGMRIDTQ